MQYPISISAIIHSVEILKGDEFSENVKKIGKYRICIEKYYMKSESMQKKPTNAHLFMYE